MKRLPVGGGPVTSIEWSPSRDWVFIGDSSGQVVILSKALNLIEDVSFPGFSRQVCDISSSPLGHKLAACADASHPVIWDVERRVVDRWLAAAHVDTHSTASLQWHPTQTLIVTGSRMGWTFLWDPRDGGPPVAQIQSHKSAITCGRWHPSGNAFLTCGRDTLVKLWDLRTLSQMCLFRCPQPLPTSSSVVPPIPTPLTLQLPGGLPVAHIGKDKQQQPEVISPAAKEAATVLRNLRGPQWTDPGYVPDGVRLLTSRTAAEPNCAGFNPVTPHIISVGDTAGGLTYFSLNTVQTPSLFQRSRTGGLAAVDCGGVRPLAYVANAHGGLSMNEKDGAIIAMDWHPLGHMLVTTSDDRYVRFW
eukprot:GHVT01029173.1.p1 GENE.GHVT01029173.1~~GHVT01029173.1.p1  ORF type:complete len:360 (-),score=23.67 GHVT01029173.1:924-2003(-)